MGLLNRLLNFGSNLSGLDGATQNVPNFQDSKYIEGDETLNPGNQLDLNPGDSTLDLDGDTPSKYVDNLPE